MGFGNDKRKASRFHRLLLWVPEPIRCVSMVSFLRFLALCLLVAFFCLGIFFFDEVKEHSLECLEWIRSLGFLYGSIALCIVNILGAMLFLPCLPFTLASGFLYGCFAGTVIVTVSANVASVASFIIARYLARRLVEEKLGSKGSKFRVIDNAISKDGFRIVFLIRSSPIHPYGVCNYLFGLTSIPLSSYAVASSLAMLPTTICEVYFGTAMKNIADLINGDIEDSFASRLFFWGGLLTTVCVTGYGTYWLKHKLQAELDKYECDHETSSHEDSRTKARAGVVDWLPEPNSPDGSGDIEITPISAHSLNHHHNRAPHPHHLDDEDEDETSESQRLIMPSNRSH